MHLATLFIENLASAAIFRHLQSLPGRCTTERRSLYLPGYVENTVTPEVLRESESRVWSPAMRFAFKYHAELKILLLAVTSSI